MRILSITPVYPLDKASTEGLFVEAQARALVAAGVEVDVVVVKPWCPDALARLSPGHRHLVGLPPRQRRHGIDITVCRYLHIPRYHWPDRSAKACARSVRGAFSPRLAAGERYDIVHIHGSWPAGIGAPGLARELGCPLVITLHIEDDPRLVQRSRGYRTMVQQTDAIVVVGHPLARFLTPFGVEDKTHQIPNATRLPADFPALLARARQQPARPWGHVVSVSNLWPSKGVGLNLRALARLRDQGVDWYRYTVVGDGPEREPLETLARNLGIAERVVFKGRLPNEQTLAAVAAADIFSLPSWQESFGIVYLEAMACSKPAIGCNTQGAADILRPGQDGLLVAPRDVDSLAEALGRLLQNPSLAESMGKSGAERADEFTWERNAAQYLDLYRSLLGTRPPTHREPIPSPS